MAWWRAFGRLLARPTVRARALGIAAAVAWCLAAAVLLPQAPFAGTRAAAQQLLPATSAPTNTPTATDTPTSAATTPTVDATATKGPAATATKGAVTPTVAATATATSSGGDNSGGGGPVGPQPTRVNLGQPGVGSSDNGGGIAGFSPTQLTSNGLVIFTTLGCLLGVGGIAALAIGGISLVSDGWGPLLLVLLLGNRRGRRRFARKPTDDGWGD
ncbi:MAG TPA: hypothetical protein VID73_10680 [Ktedonobacterales bacterium]|jgi:hypothetical protein